MKELLTLEEQNFLPIFLELVSKNDVIFAHIDDGSAEDKVIEGIFTKLSSAYNTLRHNRDTTIGLFATDRPDLIKDDKKVLFEIK